MPSHFVSICLLVLQGAAMAFGAPCQYISKNLKQNHDSVAHVLVSWHPAGHLFSSLVKTAKITVCSGKLLLDSFNCLH